MISCWAQRLLKIFLSLQLSLVKTPRPLSEGTLRNPIFQLINCFLAFLEIFKFLLIPPKSSAFQREPGEAQRALEMQINL